MLNAGCFGDLAIDLTLAFSLPPSFGGKRFCLDRPSVATASLATFLLPFLCRGLEMRRDFQPDHRLLAGREIAHLLRLVIDAWPVPAALAI
jgi:hypothetical protein